MCQPGVVPQDFLIFLVPAVIFDCRLFCFLGGLDMNDEFTIYDLKVSIVGDPTTFVCHHQLGEAFRVQGEDLVFSQPTAFSMYSLAALLPLLPAKQRPLATNDWMLSDALIACPDPNCGAQFKIERLAPRIQWHSETTVVPVIYSQEENSNADKNSLS